MSEVRACTDDVGKATLGVAAQVALVEGVILCRVGYSAVLAVPSEVPNVAHFPAALSKAPFAQVRDASGEPGGGSRPLGGCAAEGPRTIPSGEVGGEVDRECTVPRSAPRKGAWPAVAYCQSSGSMAPSEIH